MGESVKKMKIQRENLTEYGLSRSSVPFNMYFLSLDRIIVIVMEYLFLIKIVLRNLFRDGKSIPDCNKPVFSMDEYVGNLCSVLYKWSCFDGCPRIIREYLLISCGYFLDSEQEIIVTADKTVNSSTKICRKQN
jgi:hypothetical protein